MSAVDKLIGSAIEGNVEQLQAALKAGVSANLDADKEGGTKPLHWAADNGHVEVIRALLDGKAEVLAKDKEGMTALHAAACNGRPVCMTTLLDARASLVSKDNNGWTPLHHASCCGHSDAIASLVHARANLSAKDSRNGQPLHVAATYRQVDAVRLLLDARADPLAKTSEDQTPLFCARWAPDESSEKEQVCVDLLQPAMQRLREEKHRQIAQQQRLLRFLPCLASCMPKLEAEVQWKTAPPIEIKKPEAK
eukprot:TRINITY_DN46344_c0_g1_i1.p1 TRINITY_DN46344_c0_g1~~TRINITY_DN46344_c0_g1_i1.p1  ORF type:complete len:251 (-),score=61.30 TRINITY_DN46344_c0_g1_i1:203-955(-)